MTEYTWHLETRKIKDLKPYHKNPRRLTKDQERHLAASLAKFSLIDKIIINTDNTIICGHMRLKTLQKQGHKEVECNVPDKTLTEEDVKELNIRHNKNTGEWDFDVLANEFEIPDLVNYGFTMDELDIGDIEEVKEEEKAQKDKKLSMCPQCGHEF